MAKLTERDRLKREENMRDRMGVPYPAQYVVVDQDTLETLKKR